MTVTLSARPGTTPNWNTGGANRTTPSGAKQIAGWAVGESPSSAFFNWWMNLEYQWQQWNEDAIDALNTGKADLDGDTFTGAMVFENTATFNDNVTLSGATIINQSGGATWFGDFVPESDLAYDLGTSAARFSEVHANRVLGYSADETPGSNAAVVSLNQRKTTLACGQQTTATSTAGLSTKHFNVSGITRLGAGYYRITFDRPVDDEAGIFITAPTTGATPRLGTGDVQAGGATALVRIFEESGGTMTLIDYPFSFVVIGSPDADI